MPIVKGRMKSGKIELQKKLDVPNYLTLETTAGSPGYFWANSSGVLQFGTVEPTTSTYDSAGTSLAAATGADTALSNLASVQIPNAGDLIPASDNQVSVGTDGAGMSSVFVSTSLVFNKTTRNLTLTAAEPGSSARTVNFPDPGADVDVVYLTTSQALTTKTYNGLTIVAGSDAISLIEGTATIAVAAGADLNVAAAGNVDFGTGTYNFDGNIDIASGKTVNIDAAVTIGATAAFTTSGGSAIDLDQDLGTTAAPGFATGVTIGALTLADGSITDSSHAISFGNEALTTTGTINLAEDNVNITVGASGVSDSRIFFDGSGNLTMWDSTTSTNYTLQQLATGTALNPTVTGNFTITDGDFDWTNSANDETALWTLAATTVDGIQIASSNTDSDVLQITADATTSGNLISLISVDATMTSGAYIYCYDGGAQDFAVRRYGATTIAGSASGTDALTLSAGDITVGSGDCTLTDGDFVVTLGKITVDTTGDELSYIKRNNATGTGPVFEIEDTHANGGVTLLVDSDVTDAIDAMQITHDGPASGLNITGTSATGTELTCVGPASQTTPMVLIDGATGPWIGAAGAGMLELTSDGALAATTTNLLRIEHSGDAAGAAILGNCFSANDTGAASVESYAGYISSTNNNGLQIATGATGDINLLLTSSAAGVDNMLDVDGTTGTWVGNTDVGCAHVHSDGVLAAGANLLRVTQATGAPTAASFLVEIVGGGTWAGSTDGTCLRVMDEGAVAGTSSAVYVDSTANDCMELQTTAVATSNLILTGSSGQTAAMLEVDGSPTNGFVGASGVGMLHLHGDGALADVAASTLLINYTGTPGQASNLGTCLRIVDGGTSGGGTSYSVYIDAGTNMEAIKVDSGIVVVDETLEATGGLITKVAVTDVADPPTQANMDSAFGNAAAANEGMIGIIDDASGGVNEWLCVSDGSNWFYVAKMTVGA